MLGKDGGDYWHNELNSPCDDFCNLHCSLRRRLRTASRWSALSRRVVLQQMGILRQHAGPLWEGLSKPMRRRRFDSHTHPTNTYPHPAHSQPHPSGQGVASIITEDLFNQLLKYKDDSRCKANGFYSYAAFIAAANAFPGFGTASDVTTNKRELAAFLGQTSHETTGGSGWKDAPDGPYAWGYCLKEEVGSPPPVYCNATPQWPSASGKSYYGRGPIQISWNYNYGPTGKAIGFDGINNPDIVASNATVSFKTAIWFWMTAQSPKPSSHDVMTGKWTPSGSDSAAGRAPGYGAVTNIINGGLECGIGSDSRQEDRIGFYKRYCDILGVSYGSNLDCNNQTPFGS